MPLPSKLTARLVCHQFKGICKFVLCNRFNEPPAVPFVAEMVSVVPLRVIPVICGGGAGPPVPTMIWLEPVLKVEPSCCGHVDGKFVGSRLVKATKSLGPLASGLPLMMTLPKWMFRCRNIMPSVPRIRLALGLLKLSRVPTATARPFVSNELVPLPSSAPWFTIHWQSLRSETPFVALAS